MDRRAWHIMNQESAKTPHFKRLFRLFQAQEASHPQTRLPYGQTELTVEEVVSEHGRRILERMHRMEVGRLVFGPLGKGRRLPRRVLETVGAVMDEYLEDESFYVQASNSSFLVWTPDVVGEMRKMKCNAIAAEIERRLDLQAKHPELRSRECSLAEVKAQLGADFVKRMYRIDIRKLLSLSASDNTKIAREIHRIVHGTLNEFLSVDDFFVQASKSLYLVSFSKLGRELRELKYRAITADILRQLGEKRRQARGGTEAHKRGGLGTARPKKLVSSVGSPSVNVSSASDEKETQQWARAMEVIAARRSKGSSCSVALPSDLAVSYSPMWVVKGGLLSSYICRKVAEPASSTRRRAHLIVEDEESAGRRAAETDLALITIATGVVERLLKRQRQAVVVVPIHFFTTDRPPYRDVLFEMCRQLDSKVGRLIVFELMGIPDGLPPSRLQDQVYQLKAFGRAVLGRVEIGRSSTKIWEGTGIHAIGCDLTGCGAAEDRVMAHLEKFAESASLLRMRSYVQGIPSRSLTTAAVCSGFHYIAGDAVAPPIEEPAGVKTFETSMLYQWLASNDGEKPE